MSSDPLLYYMSVLALLILYGLASLMTTGVRDSVVSSSTMSTAFIVHVLAGAIRFALFGFWAPDAGTYHSLGQQAAASLESGSDFSYIEGKEGWPWFIGWVYHLVGVNPLVMICLSGGMVVITAWYVSRTVVVKGGGRRGGRLAFTLTAYCPVLLLWGDTILREAACWMALAMATYALACLATQRPRTVPSIQLVVALGVLLQVRGTMAAIYVAALGIGLLTYAVMQSGRSLFIAAPILVPTALVVPTTVSRVAMHFGYDLEAVNRSRTELAQVATSSFGTVGSYSSPTEVLTGAMTVLPRALAGPFPWEWRPSPGMILSALDALVWWVALWTLWRCRKHITQQDFAVVLVPAVATLMPLAATSGNYGTLVRLRASSLVLMLPLLCLVLIRRRRLRSEEPAAEAESKDLACASQ